MQFVGNVLSALLALSLNNENLKIACDHDKYIRYLYMRTNYLPGALDLAVTFIWNILFNDQFYNAFTNVFKYKSCYWMGG